MNVFTRSSYYTNIILFNALFFIGLIALFKLFNYYFPGKKLMIIVGIFLLPSTLFWCSGIHKDGLILSATGLLIYCINKGLNSKFSFGKLVIILLCCLVIFALRNYVLFALMLSLISFALSYKFPSKTVSIFSAFYSIGIVLFFVVPNLNPGLNFPGFITSRREEFMALQASSRVSDFQLLPTFTSFIKFLPSAIDMAFLRPHLSEAKNLSYIPAAAEILLLLVLIITSIFLIDRKFLNLPLLLLCISFAVSVLLIAGYTIPFTGAIVRYRSLVLPFLITPLLCIIKLKRS